MPLPIVGGIVAGLVGGTKLLVAAMNSDGLKKALTSYYCPFCRKEIPNKDMVKKQNVKIDGDDYDIIKCPKCNNIVDSKLSRIRESA